MTTQPAQCIHELDLGTCSICNPKDETAAEVTLRRMIREAFERYGDEDEELVLRLVFAEAAHRQDAADLFLPLLRVVKIGIDSERRRHFERRALSAPRSQPETKGSTEPIVATSSAAPSPEQASLETRPIDCAPAREPSPPPGMTLAEFSRQHRADVATSADEWERDFCKRMLSAPVRVSGWRGTVGQLTVDRIRAKQDHLRHLASGTAESLKHFGIYERVLMRSEAQTLAEALGE